MMEYFDESDVAHLELKIIMMIMKKKFFIFFKM